MKFSELPLNEQKSVIRKWAADVYSPEKSPKKMRDEVNEFRKNSEFKKLGDKYIEVKRY